MTNQSEMKKELDWQEEIIKSTILDYAKCWLCALSEAFKDLDKEMAEKITMNAAQVCVSSWHDHMVAQHGYDPSSHDLDSFIKAINGHTQELYPGSYTILEDENTVYSVFKPEKCVCPLVLAGY